MSSIISYEGSVNYTLIRMAKIKKMKEQVWTRMGSNWWGYKIAWPLGKCHIKLNAHLL